MTNKKLPLSRRLHGVMFKLPYMITCEEFEEFIHAYLEGSLPKTKHTIFQIHLKLCRECRDYLERYEASCKLTKDAVLGNAAKDIENVPEDLIKAIIKTRQQ